MLIIFSCKKDEEIEFQSSCYPSHLLYGVIASYDFSNGSLDDGTSNGADLLNVLQAIPASDRTGNSSCAYYINGFQQDQYLVTSNTSFLNDLKAFSISAWYQPSDSVRDGGDYEVLVGRNSEPGNKRCPDRVGEWSLGLYDCRQAVFGHNNSIWNIDPVPAPPSCQEYVIQLTGIWRHAVAVYNNDSYKLYIDGVLQDTATGTANCTNQYLAQDKGDLFIGRFYKGIVDDILIYNRELTSTEIYELYTSPPCCQ